MSSSFLEPVPLRDGQLAAADLDPGPRGDRRIHDRIFYHAPGEARNLPLGVSRCRAAVVPLAPAVTRAASKPSTIALMAAGANISSRRGRGRRRGLPVCRREGRRPSQVFEPLVRYAHLLQVPEHVGHDAGQVAVRRPVAAGGSLKSSASPSPRSATDAHAPTATAPARTRRAGARCGRRGLVGQVRPSDGTSPSSNAPGGRRRGAALRGGGLPVEEAGGREPRRRDGVQTLAA